jgi:redox-sensitive bicupin YhaK (pirin superfamily)
MIRYRDRGTRGESRTGWLDSRHSFSFAHYHDPAQMGFRTLRVINEDRVIPGAGFPAHRHRDMEIITYVLEGALEHKDSLGNGAVIRPGEVQRMTAGTGIAHSEFNPSATEPVHFLQIWIIPERTGLPPSYEQKAFPASARRGRLARVADPEGRDGAVIVHQQARLYLGALAAGESVAHALASGRAAWLQVAQGIVALNGTELRTGDGAAVEGEPTLAIAAATDAEILLFDLD